MVSTIMVTPGIVATLIYVIFIASTNHIVKKDGSISLAIKGATMWLGISSVIKALWVKHSKHSCIDLPCHVQILILLEMVKCWCARFGLET